MEKVIIAYEMNVMYNFETGDQSSHTLSKYSLKYSRTPKIETADLSRYHIGLRLSQFHVGCLLRIYSITAI